MVYSRSQPSLIIVTGGIRQGQGPVVLRSVEALHGDGSPWCSQLYGCMSPMFHHYRIIHCPRSTFHFGTFRDTTLTTDDIICMRSTMTPELQCRLCPALVATAGGDLSLLEEHLHSLHRVTALATCSWPGPSPC